MKLSFGQQHKSILSFPSIDLPRFTVVTGVNGSGKTHLLEAIEKGAIRVEGVKEGAPEIRRFHHTNLLPKHGAVVDPSTLNKERQDLWVRVNKKIVSCTSEIRTYYFNAGASSEQVQDVVDILGCPYEDLREVIGGDVHRFTAGLATLLEVVEARVLAEIPVSLKQDRAADLPVRVKHLLSLSRERFFDLLPLSLKPVDLFQHDFGRLFTVYHRLREQNRIDRYYGETGIQSRPFLSEEGFLATHGEPPWDIVNRILVEAGLALQFIGPSGTIDEQYSLRLVNTDIDCDVKYETLSSGERVIISLAHCIFYSHSSGQGISLPKLLLLDEPDAPLHPTMMRGFIDTLRNVLVSQHNVSIILTTHSPTTVAYSPRDAIYRLDRKPRALTQIDRDSAISLLTGGLTTVLPSTRFVITEAKFDQDVLQKIFASVQHSGAWCDPPNLVFIRASDQDNSSGGGSGQVAAWSEKLRSFGIPLFRGLLDRDTGNVPTQVVEVLGRYSIENYLCDPLLIYACLVEEDRHREVLETPEFSQCDVHQLNSMEDSALQRIADAVFARIHRAKTELSSENHFEILYANGKKILAPAWLRDYRGHDLSSIVQACFNDRTKHLFNRSLDRLVLMLTSKLRGFVPLDMIDIFKRLAQ